MGKLVLYIDKKDDRIGLAGRSTASYTTHILDHGDSRYAVALFNNLDREIGRHCDIPVPEGAWRYGGSLYVCHTPGMTDDVSPDSSRPVPVVLSGMSHDFGPINAGLVQRCLDTRDGSFQVIAGPYVSTESANAYMESWLTWMRAAVNETLRGHDRNGRHP